jgi:hypothetical protein
MRLLLFAALVIAIGLPASSQTAPAPTQTLPKDPRAILAAAAPYYDFSDPALKPFHLKATYQLYDDQGNPSEQGTFEYWWASPKVYRLSWTRPHAMHTSWHTADGKEAYIESGERLRYFEREMYSDLIMPLPTAAQADPKTVALERHNSKIAGVELSCVSLISHNSRPMGDEREYPTYCFDTSLPDLRLTYQFTGLVLVSYDQVVRMYGKFLAREVHVIAGKQTLLSLKVDTIDSLNPSDVLLIPPKEAIFKPDAVQSRERVKPGSPIKATPGLYPEAANVQKLRGGEVLIEAVVGTDGNIKDPRVIYASSPLFAAPSLEAVSQWHFEPYQLDGAPVEADIVVNSTFVRVNSTFVPDN